MLRFCDEKLGKIVIYLDIVFLDIVFSLFKAEEICEGESTQSCEARFSPLRHPSFRARNSARPFIM